MSRPVIIAPSNPEWQSLFAAEAGILRPLLADNLIAIHHIGSTAVPGLAAKLIIDVLPVVRRLQDVDALNAAFSAAGYTPWGEHGIPGRRFFHKGSDLVHTHHLHIFSAGSPDIERHLALRDYLRAQPAEADAYADLKRDLARRYPHDVDAYIAGKHAFVQALEQRAHAWLETRRAGSFLRTQRLDLIALPMHRLGEMLTDPAGVKAALNILLPEDLVDDPVRRAISMKLEKMKNSPREQHPWFTYWLMLLRTQGVGVGLLGFKGAPDDAGSVEIGYGIHPSFGGQGLMTEAVQALVNWAFNQPACRAVTACNVLPSNLASQRVLEKAGFSLAYKTSQGLDFQIVRPR